MRLVGLAGELRIKLALLLPRLALLRGRFFKRRSRCSLFFAPRPFPAAPLVARGKSLIVVPGPIPAAPRMYVIVVYRPLPAAPLVVRCMYMAVVPGPILRP